MSRKDEITGKAAQEALTPAEIRSKAASGVLAYVFRGLTTKFMSFVSVLVLARYIAPRDFGLLALATTVLMVSQILASGGFAAGLVKNADEPERADIAAMQAFQLAIAFTAAGLTAVIGLALGGAGALAALMGLSLPLSVLRVPLVVHAQRHLQYVRLVRSDLIETGSYNLMAIALVVAGLGVWGVAITTVATTAVGLVVLRRMVGQPLIGPRWNWSRVRPLLSLGAAFQALQVSNALRNQGTNILIAGVAGSAALGFWNLTSRIALVVTVLFGSLYSVSFSAISRLLATGESLDRTLLRSFGLTSVAIGVFAVPLSGAAPALVPVVFGDRWTPVAEVLPFVLAGLLINGPVSTAATGYLLAVGDARSLVRNVLVHTAVFFVVMTPLLPSLGVVAAGFGFVASAMTDVLMLSAVVRQRTGVSALRVTLPILIIAIAAGGTGYQVASAVGENLEGIIAGAVVGETLFLAVVASVRAGVLRDLVGVLGRAAGGRAAPFRRMVRAVAR